MTYLCYDNEGKRGMYGLNVTKIQVREYANAIKAPVETGQMSFDNKVIMPMEVRITGVIETQDKDVARSARSGLSEMIANRKFKFYSVVTDGRTYKNLMMIDCPKTIDRDEPDWEIYELTFVEVLLVQNKSYTPANPNDKNTTKSGANNGNRSTSTAPAIQMIPFG